MSKTEKAVKKPKAKAEKVLKPKEKPATHKVMYKGDKKANVHVSEIDNYKSGGWSEKCCSK